MNGNDKISLHLIMNRKRNGNDPEFITFNNEQEMNGNDKISLHLIMNRKRNGNDKGSFHLIMNRK